MYATIYWLTSEMTQWDYVEICRFVISSQAAEVESISLAIVQRMGKVGRLF